MEARASCEAFTHVSHVLNVQPHGYADFARLFILSSALSSALKSHTNSEGSNPRNRSEG